MSYQRRPQADLRTREEASVQAAITNLFRCFDCGHAVIEHDDEMNCPDLPRVCRYDGDESFDRGETALCASCQHVETS